MQTNINRKAFAVLLALALFCVGWLIFRAAKPTVHPIAVIRVGENVLREIDLSAADDGQFSIEEETGIPIVFEIADHKIRFVSSDCPDLICVHTGWVENEMQSAVCMPNSVSVTVTER
jgi:hypothetical protein